MQLNACFTSENIVQSFSQLWGITFGIYCWSVKNDKWNFSTLKSCADAKTVSGKSEKFPRFWDFQKMTQVRVSVTGRWYICDAGLQFGEEGIFFSLNRGAQVILKLFPVSDVKWVSQSNWAKWQLCCWLPFVLRTLQSRPAVGAWERVTHGNSFGVLQVLQFWLLCWGPKALPLAQN